MEVLEAAKSFEIQALELNNWKQRAVQNVFFELALIKDGTGIQSINYGNYRYSRGSIFLLPHLKCHSFSIDTPKNFVFLKFTDSFFKNISCVTIARNDVLKKLLYPFYLKSIAWSYN
jgi:AraC family transcriptional regulator